MKKMICALLALSMLVMPAVLTGCSDEGENPDSQATSAPAAAADTTVPAETAPAETTWAAPAAKDTQGFKFRVLCTDNKLWIPIHFTTNETETGEIIPDALYRREILIEELFNCEVENIVDSGAPDKLANCVYSGTDLCEIAFLTGSKTLTAAKSGYVMDFNQIDGFNRDCPWWDQRIQQEYLIGKRLFTLEGDINMRDDLRTMTVVYNKDSYNDMGYNTAYGTPYSLVNEGKWTYELLMEMIKDKTEDPQNENGKWGMVSEVSGPYYFFLGSGLKAVSNENGEFTLHLDDDNVFDFMEKVMSMTVNPDIMIVNNGKYFTSGDVWTEARRIFKEGSVLFRSTTLSAVNDFTDMKSDYGILPIPNAGNSEQYYCYVSGSNSTPLSIPRNVADLETAVMITEAMAYYSMFSDRPNVASLREAFYDLLGDARLARTYDDTAMLDIVFASKTYDIEQALGLTGFESSIYSLAKASNVNIASTIKAIKKSSANKVSTLLDTLDEKYK